jgi:hypothetical protein
MLFDDVYSERSAGAASAQGWRAFLHVRTTGMLAAICSLGACGGGGGGSIVSMPPPPSYTKLADITASTPLATAAATSEYHSVPGEPVPTNGVWQSSVDISYDPVSQTYTLRGTPTGSGPTIEQKFGPGDRLPETTYLYERIATANGQTDVQRLYIGNTPLTYVNYGTWESGRTTSSFDQKFDTIYFTYGIPTQAGDMPRAGTASYSLTLGGSGIVNSISGTGTLTANFATSSVDVSLALKALVPRPLATPYDLATVTGSGTISSSGGNPGFSAGLAGGGYSGSVKGLFYGPQAAEVGGAFTVTKDGVGGDRIAGALLGKKG